MNELLSGELGVGDYAVAIAALNRLPDRCAADINDLASRIGTEKTTLIGWLRADLNFARLVDSKVLK
jgi:hypothetical protein